MRETKDVFLGMHLLEIEITTRCNLNCQHCYNKASEIQDMPIESIRQILNFAEDNSVQSVVISGGEASLHPDFQGITRIIGLKNKLRRVVQTNGWAVKHSFDYLSNFDVVHISFEPDNSNVRIKSGEETIELAKKLLQKGIYTYLFATIHSQNVDQIDWMVEKANNAKVDIGFNFCSNNGCNQNLLLKIKQRRAIVKKMYLLYQQKKILRFTDPMISTLSPEKQGLYKGIKGGCTAGVAACVILPNGDVAPCPFLRIRAGNIYENNLREIWLDSEIFRALRKRTNFDEPCRSCKYLSYCGGCRKSAFIASGKLNGADPNCILE